MKNQIESNNLKLDIDCLYNKQENQIEVYSSVYWTAENKEKYQAKEKIIANYKIETELFLLVSWCDCSDFDYWVIQQEEENYVAIDVVLKKAVDLYTQTEIDTIKEAITVADEYFIDKLL